MGASQRRHIARVFLEPPLADDARARITGAKAHHLHNVLRLRCGDAVTVFDGAGGEIPARIEESARDRVTLHLARRVRCERESPLRITLAQAMAVGERMDYALAKAVELGVAAIQPLLTDGVKQRPDTGQAAKKQQRWQRVVVAAAEQSGREVLPPVAPLLPLAEWLGAPPAGRRLVLEPSAALGLGESEPTPSVVLLVGPESGWSAADWALIRAGGFCPVVLGPRVLRTETAGPAALAALQLLWGDLGQGKRLGAEFPGLLGGLGTADGG